MWEVDREWYQAAKDLHFGLKLLSGLLIFLFFMACFVRNANAAVVQSPYDGVVWGIGVVEKPNGSSMESYNPVEGCIVNAPNAFSAACFAVGGNPSTLTSEQKALLSNASTGGDFYTFTQYFANYGGSFDSPDDWYIPKFYDIWNKLEDLYGDYLYAATFSSAQLRGAKADYQLILDGGDLGGGGSGGGYDITTMTGNPRLWDASYTGFTYVWNGTYTTAVGNTSKVIVPETITVSFTNVSSNTTLTSWLNTYAVEGRTIYANYMRGTIEARQGNGCEIMFYSIPDDKVKLTYIKNAYYNNQIIYNITTTSGTYPCYYLLYKGDLPFDGTTLSVDANNPFRKGSLSRNPNNGGYGFDSSSDIAWLSPSDGAPIVPPTNWPDNPTVVAPEPPELPDPYNPTIDDQPIDPTPPQNPIYPPILSITEETYTADLQGILDAMDAHCQHLRSALHTEMSNLWTVLSTKMTNDFSTFRAYMTGQIGWLGDLISDEMEATRDYLRDLFEWLADEFEYTFTGTAYDDNTLISWLRKIYYRLGSGGVNTRPTDPVANPVDAGDWLSQLIANLFSALNALAGGLLTSVGSALDLMHTKFPFSLPWDLLAILALFEASPTAPDFDVPIYTLSTVGDLVQVGAWEIDLSDLSPYLEGIRWMQKICFVYFLAVHTKDWMDTLEKVVA